MGGIEMGMSNSTYSLSETNASEEQIKERSELERLFHECKLPMDELMTQLGLFIRGSYLVKFLVLNDLYLRIKDIPGDIFEFGTRFGHNLVVFENLRAIYEPFNKTRRMVGFDTFDGYRNFSERDVKGSVFSEETYHTYDHYEDFLAHLLKVHERNNILGHISGNHRLVKGDVTETAPRYFSEHPEAIVALAYFDMGLYNPTKMALQAIKPHLISGSVILLDEFTWSESPGEAIAFKEVFGKCGYRLTKSVFTPMRAIVTIL
jgi:hypothetical protein